MVRLRRLELPRVLSHSDLNAARLPVPPQPHIKDHVCDNKTICILQVKYYINKYIVRIIRLTDLIEWKISNELIDYDFAILEMEKRVLDIKRNSKKELVWLLEHKSIFTAGTSAKNEDLINNKVEIRYTGRGGQWTWHGPGQRVVYLMLNLKNRLPDIKAYVYALEELIISSLSDFNINGMRVKNQPGVWVRNNNGFHKIAALGIRISSWISYHGISINLNPNLEEFRNIIPCGIQDGGVTSLHRLNAKISLQELDYTLHKYFKKIFEENGSFCIK